MNCYASPRSVSLSPKCIGDALTIGHAVYGIISKDRVASLQSLGALSLKRSLNPETFSHPQGIPFAGTEYFVWHGRHKWGIRSVLFAIPLMCAVPNGTLGATTTGRDVIFHPLSVHRLIGYSSHMLLCTLGHVESGLLSIRKSIVWPAVYDKLCICSPASLAGAQLLQGCIRTSPLQASTVGAVYIIHQGTCVCMSAVMRLLSTNAGA